MDFLVFHIYFSTGIHNKLSLLIIYNVELLFSLCYFSWSSLCLYLVTYFFIYFCVKFLTTNITLLITIDRVYSIWQISPRSNQAKLFLFIYKYVNNWCWPTIHFGKKKSCYLKKIVRCYRFGIKLTQLGNFL